MMKRVWTVLLAVVFANSQAWAQDDDDDLAPLAPIGKPKAKPKPKPRPKAQPRQQKKTTKLDDDDDLAPLAPIATKGDLNVKAPNGLSGAVLSIDGREVGTLPMPAQSVTPGEHTVTVKRPGYAAFVKKVLVTGGKSVDVEPRLTAVAAVLTVTSDVEGAQVLLNGRNIGTAPLKDVEVPAGPAEVAVIKEGFKEDAQKINFVAGKDYPVVVRFNAGDARTLAASDRPLATNLTPLNDPTPVGGVTASDPEPITTKWYFWTGVAVVVVAAAAVTTGVLVGNANSTARAPEPTTVCTGMCDAVLNF
ncbi:MAG: hypothetical protein DI536_34245 [Archangium gephyra]|uniref:PEGA domain-containing protein n=1 Tax=Archangium gephyra TaxID=48 RepID=A0A2W5SP70_9BACT|nr:MAG: hypothetical protein DI536_34245 [Archangium gephyra]